MLFNFGALARILNKQLFHSKNTPYRLTSKRSKFLILFMFLFYIPIEISAWIGFLLDDIFFRGYRGQTVRQPIFIIGNARSGTTFIHRLIAKDTQNFTTMKLWEIVFAPSITQRKIIHLFSSFDWIFGGLVRKQVNRWEQTLFGQIENHKIGLQEPEEDEYLFMHVCSSAVIWTFFPIDEEVEPYFYYDTAVPDKRRQKDMLFYHQCLQRHIYFHGGNKQFLSKNPIFSGKIQSLKECFPDAKFIYMARSPMSVVPSLISYMATGFHLFCQLEEKYPYREKILKLIDYYYQYPSEVFTNYQREDFMVVNYDDLVGDPAGTVQDVYNRLQMRLNLDYLSTLIAETNKARKYKSSHDYSLEDIGLSSQEIQSMFSASYQNYQFESFFENEKENDVVRV